jgi:ABC-2 type transport system ATP-binding protein
VIGESVGIEIVPGTPPSAAARVLEVKDAFKRFGAIEALKGASLALHPGELLALLGPNGAGKTTLLRAITGRVRLDRGVIELDGRERTADERRGRLGVVPQEIALYPLLTARENLTAFGRLSGVAALELRDRVERALVWTGLADRANEPVKDFSGGMKRRLNLACGVLHEPRIVLLDEPTVGVDPQSRERIYEMLASLRSRGAAMLLTTHQLEEAEERCDRVAILDHGVVIAAGTPAELVERTVGGERRVRITLDAPLDRLPGFDVTLEGSRLEASVKDLGTELPALLAGIARAGRRVEDLDVTRHGLQAAFLHLTGKELRE